MGIARHLGARNVVAAESGCICAEGEIAGRFAPRVRAIRPLSLAEPRAIMMRKPWLWSRFRVIRGADTRKSRALRRNAWVSIC